MIPLAFILLNVSAWLLLSLLGPVDPGDGGAEVTGIAGRTLGLYRINGSQYSGVELLFKAAGVLAVAALLLLLFWLRRGDKSRSGDAREKNSGS